MLWCGDTLDLLFNRPWTFRNESTADLFTVPPSGVFTVIITAVCIPPQVDTTLALTGLYGTINRHKTSQPLAVFIVAANFNKANLRKVPSASCLTQALNTLDNIYTSFRDGYEALSRPLFGKSDHASILLLPVYRQKLNTGSVHDEIYPMLVWAIGIYATGLFWFSWLDCALGRLRQWHRFTHRLTQTYTQVSQSHRFHTKCIDDVAPRITVWTFHNQKPWVNSDIRAMLKAQTTTWESLGIWMSTRKPDMISANQSETKKDSTGTKWNCIIMALLPDACGVHYGL